ncbi:MAG: hypothetical protein HY753_09475, partial [Nitrospirae bacterium]|nr:hypothetical protein [Nitrospirota bacterium]
MGHFKILCLFGHVWSEWTYAAQDSCVRQRQCTRCGKTDRAVLPTHSWQIMGGQQPRDEHKKVEINFNNITIAHEVLQLERDSGIEVPFSVEEKLNAFLQTIQSAFSHAPHYSYDIKDTLNHIASVIDQEVTVTEGHMNVFSHALRQRIMDCTSYCALYLAAAQRMRLPISLAILPSHAYIIWQKTDKESICWETLMMGRGQHPENWFRITFGCRSSLTQMKNCGFFLPLNHDQILSLFYDKLSRYMNDHNRYQEALHLINTALKLHPNN